MNVLVTGGSGAIGHFVADELRDRGHAVTIFDLQPPEAEVDQHVDGDVTDSEAVAKSVSKADTVVHLAAILGVPCREDPRRANAVNVGGTLNVFDAAERHDVRVLYASSKAVFGPVTGRHGHPTFEPIGEDANRNPINTYGVTKLACEEYADRYRARGVELSALRFGITYGPGKGTDYEDTGYIDDMIRRAHAGKHVKVSGSDQRLDATYFGDVARGIAAAVETPSATRAVYHIGSGRASALTDFVDALREQTNGTIEPLGGLGPAGADYPRYCQLDISRARTDFGYTPNFGPVEGVAEYLSVLDSQ